MAKLIEGRADGPTELEAALVALARKSFEAPARLGPADLEPLRTASGDAALAYALVISAFHFINRVADILDVDPEAIPRGLRRLEPLRKFGVWVGSRLMGRMDLGARPFDAGFEETAATLDVYAESSLGTAAREALAPLSARPHIVEVLRLGFEERDEGSSLDRETLARVHAGVEAALPDSLDEAEGFHPRPADPLDELIFVGTRYAYRTTDELIERVRALGFDDLAILDLAIAIAEANQWARLHRLAGLDPRFFYLPVSAKTDGDVADLGRTRGAASPALL